jgi:hypothetical protein
MPMLPFKFSKSVNISRTIKNSIFKIWFWSVCGGGGGEFNLIFKTFNSQKSYKYAWFLKKMI